MGGVSFDVGFGEEFVRKKTEIIPLVAACEGKKSHREYSPPL